MTKATIGLLFFFISFQAFAAAVHLTPVGQLTGTEGVQRCGPFAVSPNDAEAAYEHLQIVMADYRSGCSNSHEIEVAKMDLVEKQYCSGSLDVDKVQYCKAKRDFLMMGLDEMVASRRKDLTPSTSQMDRLNQFCNAN